MKHQTISMTTTSYSCEEKKQEQSKAFTLEELGSNVVECTYLIKGSVLQKAAELMELQEKGVALPFPKFYRLHLGNPQITGQPPITFLRQVVAATFCPSLLDMNVFPEDVCARARHYLSNIPYGAIGAYSEAAGFKVFRKSVEQYIAKRDGYPADAENIYLLDGTLDGMTFFLNLVFSIQNAGVMFVV
eukprot:TRINITY_DN64974_c3_g1_i1.p4 TRINITY_DN64974_c3_g1~~TRINITY_DN64974_c3_g1_i1.p4  ORF type:complete len:188 (+),score=30.18 TRINITY_DN64974_c3_g1_i1:220-783(+)